MGLPSQEHYDSVLGELREIRNLLDAQSRRVVPDLEPFSFNVNSNGPNVIIPAVPGNRIFVPILCCTAAGAVTATFGYSRSGSATGAFVPFPGAASTGNAGDQAIGTNSGFALAVEFPYFIFRTEPNTSFALNLSGATAVGGFGCYWVA